MVVVLFLSSCSKIDSNKPVGAPAIIDEIKSITSTVARIKGTSGLMSNDKDGGICWSTTNTYPDINDHVANFISSGGTFSANLLALHPSTTYYVRTYFIEKRDVNNSAANKVAYGKTMSFTTLDIPTVRICNHTWMQTNLDVDTYRNGDPIPQVTDIKEWENLTTGAWCYLSNDSTNYGPVYGKLYNYYAVADPRGLAPVGWHVSTKADWEDMINMFGGDQVAGSALKETGTGHWLFESGATNSSGFTGLPGSARNNNEDNPYGLGRAGLWWTEFAFGYQLNVFSNSVDGYSFPEQYRAQGLSVRCVKD